MLEITTQNKYKRIFALLDKNVEATRLWNKNNTNILQEAANIIKKSKRVFVTASGSSIPSAQILVDLMNTQTSFFATFVTTSQLISIQTLSEKDCVILISQGFNRSDAKINAYKTKKYNAQFILFTATEVQIPHTSIIKFYPEPDNEKVFSRPVGVITSYISVVYLFDMLVNNSSNIIKINKITPDDKTCQSIVQFQNVIVLSSGAGVPASSNVALALREGSGIKSDFFDIENFGHGQYIPYIKQGEHTFFLLFTNSKDIVLSRAVQRIKPLLDKTEQQYQIIDCANDVSYLAGLSILYFGGSLVGKLNAITNYDMNEPRGKEENRTFHLVTDTYYD